MVLRLGQFLVATKVVASRGAGQDRADVFATGDGLVIALADGAGGTGHGAEAAEGVIAAVAAHLAAAGAMSWKDVLAELDRKPVRLGHGQTTAVVLQVDERGINGAAVGDSAGWLIGDGSVEDITADQRRKPLLGSGALVIVTGSGPLGGRMLLVASDGLLRYARPADIARVARQPDIDLAVTALIELVRLPSGELQDDVAIVLLRESSSVVGGVVTPA